MARRLAAVKSKAMATRTGQLATRVSSSSKAKKMAKAYNEALDVHKGTTIAGTGKFNIRRSIDYGLGRAQTATAESATRSGKAVHAATGKVLKVRKFATDGKILKTSAEALQAGGNGGLNTAKHVNNIYKSSKAIGETTKDLAKSGVQGSKKVLQRVAARSPTKASGKVANKILSSASSTHAKAGALRQAVAETKAAQVASQFQDGLKTATSYASQGTNEAVKIQSSVTAIHTSTKSAADEIQNLNEDESKN
jgi:hypothetical protein